MLLDTLSGPFAKSHTTDVSVDDLARIPTITEPAGNGVIELSSKEGIKSPNALLLVPIGTGANNAVVTAMRVYGWRRVVGTQGASAVVDIWIPVLLVDIAAVFGNIVGIAASALLNTYFLMDTITITTGNTNVSVEVLSPTGDVPAHLIVDVKGFQKVSITFDLGANATALNCLYARL